VLNPQGNDQPVDSLSEHRGNLPDFRREDPVIEDETGEMISVVNTLSRHCATINISWVRNPAPCFVMQTFGAKVLSEHLPFLSIDDNSPFNFY
jgi:hypothetical protein